MKSHLFFAQNGVKWHRQGESCSFWSLFWVWWENMNAAKVGTCHNNNNNNNRIQRRYSKFFTISSQRRKLSQTCAQVARAQSCANHVQRIERLSRASVVLRATWYEGTAQLLSLTELKSHLFELNFIGWTIKPMKEGRKPEYPEKTPGDMIQKMPRTKARRFKPQARLEPTQ